VFVEADAFYGPDDVVLCKGLPWVVDWGAD